MMSDLVYTYFAQYRDGTVKIGASARLRKRLTLLKKPRLLFALIAYQHLGGYRVEGAWEYF